MKSVNRDLNPRQYITLLDTADQLHFLMRFGLLAPSSHNIQPWLFRITGSVVELLANPDRRLVGSDPKDREFYISLGAALGIFRLAVEAYGLEYTSEEFDLAEPMRIARFNFSNLKAGTAHEVNYKVLEAIVSRHTNRYPFTDQHIPGTFAEFIKNLNSDDINIHYITDPAQKQKIAGIVGDSIEAAFKTKVFTDELSHWIRPSLKRYNDGMPGYNIAVPWALSLVMPWMIRHLPMSKQQRAMNEPLLTHAPSFIIITARNDSASSWIRVGETFVRIAVEGEQQGIKIGVQAAPIEIGEFYKSLQQTLATDQRPEMFFRLGYTNARPTPSPRLSVDQVLVK